MGDGRDFSHDGYTTVDLGIEGGVAHVRLNRPQELNTMNAAFWPEMRRLFRDLDADTRVRAVVVSSTGKHFTAGLDLKWAGTSLAGGGGDLGRQREKFRRHVLEMQDSFTVVDRCRVPVIMAVQGGCIGGGVDFATACDIRLASADAFFTIQEVNVGIVADVGTLQRIPHLLPQGLIRELAYTGRRWTAQEAAQQGFVNRVLPDHQACLDAALAMAREIAAKSPLVIAGVKQVLNHGRGRTIEEGLEYVALWNAAMLQGDDMKRAVTAQMTKGEAAFDDLAA